MKPFELRVVRPEAGDCIIPYDVDVDYDVVFHKECTVREFIDEILKNVESGYVWIGNFDGPVIEYINDEIVFGGFSPDILDARIKNATAHGSWIGTNYMLDI